MSSWMFKKVFFYTFFTSFLLSCNTPKMAMKMCSVSFETTIMFHKQTHTRAPIHTSRHGIIMKRSSFQADKKTLMGAVGICNDNLMRQCIEMWIHVGWSINDGVSTHESLSNREENNRGAENNEPNYWIKSKNPSCQIMHLILNSFQSH